MANKSIVVSKTLSFFLCGACRLESVQVLSVVALSHLEGVA